MKKHFLKSFAVLAMLFTALSLSAQSGVDWATIDWIGSTDANYNNKFKCSTTEGLVNIQHPGFASEIGIYMSFPAAGIECNLTGISVQGAGIIMHLSAFTAKETEVVVNYAGGSRTFWVYYADGTDGGGEGGEEPEPTPEPEPGVIDKWTGVDWVAASDNKYKVSHECLTQVVSVQQPGWAAEKGIYVTVPAGISSCTVNGAIDGAGMILYLSSFTAKETEVTITHGLGSCTFWVYYADGTDGGGEGGEAPDPTPEPEPGVIDWSSIAWLGNGSGLPENTDKYKISQNCLQQVVNIQKPGWADEPGIYVTASGAIASCSLNGAIDGAGIVLYLSSFSTKETEVTINYAGGSCTFWVYYADGTEGGATPTEVYDVNFALASNGSSAEATSGNATAAIDNNAGTRWESAQEDPQTWTLDLGQARIFNTLEIVWEGAYGKTFTISASEDKETWTPIWTVEGQQLAGFPYTQTQTIDKTTARYIQFHGTARGTGYGYSFWEFRVYLAGVSTLTTLEAEPTADLTKVGEEVTINITPKDQNGQVMNDAGEVIYTITPADAGTITNNIYIPTKIGMASIVATIGEVSAPAFEVFAYDGDNVALSTNINESKIVAQSEFAPSGTDAWHAIDGNEGSVWQGSATNGTAGDEAARTYDSWFVVDFGAKYDVNLVSINFEGACSQEYHVDFSADNATWNVAYNYVGNAGINRHTKLIYGNDLQNTTKVRYARFYSTKAATEWGMKIFEFKVFGTESASLTKAVSASVNDAAMGTATVTQDGEAVTEVATGSEVTFTATANDGYTFVNWSDGNTNPSFTTTVDAAMHLTANFRALGTVYCNTEMTVDGHTIYVTMKRSAPETYQLIVRSEENLTNFGGTNFYRSNNIHVIDLRNQGVLSKDKHILTATFTAETAPYMGSPLYVIFEGIGERTYPKFDDIEYDVECSEEVTITGLALNPSTVSIMLGGTQTLKPVFTPAHAFDNELEWTSSNESVATVDANGLVTTIAEGEVVITATLESNPAISATCNVTVTAFTASTFYGYGSNAGVDFAYNLTYNANGTVTIVADILTNNPGMANTSFSIDEEWRDMTKNTDGTYTRTSEKTFSVGQEVHCFLYAPYTGGAGRIDFNYTIGSSNERPTVVVESVTLDKTTCDLTPNESVQLIATVNPGYATNKSVTWSSSDNNVATVDANGLVTAKSAGTTTITVTTADGGKTATCTVNVVAALTNATYHASASFIENGRYVGVNYSITRTAERKLHYEVIVNGTVEGLVMQVNDGDWHTMAFDANTKVYSYTSESTYTDGDVLSGFFYPAFTGGAGRWDFVNYTVGSTNSPVRTKVAFNDTQDPQTLLQEYMGQSVDVIVNRSLVSGMYNTICLPFSLQSLLGTDLAGSTLVRFLNAEVVGEGSNRDLTLYFTPAQSIEAGVPYLIQPVTDIAGPMIFNSVTIACTEGTTSGSGDVIYQGVLAPTELTANDYNSLFLISNNQLAWPEVTGSMNGMRGYFKVSPSTASLLRSVNARARIQLQENQTTSLPSIEESSVMVKFIRDGQLYIQRGEQLYNAQGQVVE